MKPVEVFKAEDFRNSEGYLLTSDKCAEAANKLLSERLVKYYGNPNNEPGYWVRGNDPFYTHIIYGLEPQPIQREAVKREITREDLARAWDRHCVITEKYNQSDSSPTFKDFCKELGYE